jgi:hypothetical protein
MPTIKPTRATSIAFSLAAVTFAMLATSLPAAAHATGQADLARVRAATARYHDLAVAQANGYALLTDTAGIACIDNPGVGAMGVHYANSALVGAGVLDATRPQALVYAPTANGQLRLAAVEYVLFQAAWDAAHPAPPALFGQQFMLTPDGNRFGLPAFYSLHAWVWQPNPSGILSMWNPQVSCPAPTAGH